MNSVLYRTTGYMLTRETPGQREQELRQAAEHARDLAAREYRRRAERQARRKARVVQLCARADATKAEQRSPTQQRAGRVTFSQFGEDITAAHLLRNVTNGFYVDIGAHHPLRHSNTALLHMRGWRGINLEPVQEGIRFFERLRPHDTNVRAAIHNELDQVTLYKFNTGLCNTVIPTRAAALGTSRAPAGEEVVPALSLNDVFDRYVPDGVRVNYMTVDIEGYDTEAVLAFDLARYQPDVMCIEVLGRDLLCLGTHPVVRHLINHGYFPYAVNIYSLTFVHVDAAADPGRLAMRRVGVMLERSRRARSLVLG